MSFCMPIAWPFRVVPCLFFVHFPIVFCFPPPSLIRMLFCLDLSPSSSLFCYHFFIHSLSSFLLPFIHPVQLPLFLPCCLLSFFLSLSLCVSFFSPTPLLSTPSFFFSFCPLSLSCHSHFYTSRFPHFITSLTALNSLLSFSHYF